MTRILVLAVSDDDPVSGADAWERSAVALAHWLKPGEGQYSEYFSWVINGPNDFDRELLEQIEAQFGDER